MHRWLCSTTLFLLMLQIAGCAPDPLEPLPVGPTNGWRVFHPRPGGFHLYDVWGESPTNIWAVGALGTIMHWNGRTTRMVDSPTTVQLETLDGWSRNNLYAAGETDLLHYDGQTWQIDSRLNDQEITGLLCAPDGRLYLTGTMGLWVRGQSGWHGIDGPTSLCRAIWLGADGFIRVGEGSRIWILIDGLAQLEQDLEFVILQGHGRYVIAGSKSGRNHIFQHPPESSWIEVAGYFWPARAVLDLDGLVFANNNGITSNTTQVWDNNSGRWIHGLARAESGHILACGYNGTLLCGTPKPDSFLWNESALDLGFSGIQAFSGTGCDNIWATEWWSRILHFDGQEWHLEFTQLPSDAAVMGVQALKDGSVVAHGGGEIALRNPDGNWSLLTPPGSEVHQFHALAADSIITATAANFQLWNGRSWIEIGPTTGRVYSLAATSSGQLYALVDQSVTTLWTWNGSTFEQVLEIPGLNAGLLCGSRGSEALWIGGNQIDKTRRSILYRFQDGELLNVTRDSAVPWPITAMTERRPGDLFVLAGNEIRRFKDGHWSRETGLPTGDYYRTIWSHPDCGVFVEGQPTYFKDFPHE